MILITGAGGGVGRALVRELRTKGETVRAFVKNDVQAAAARSDGATEVVVGDIRSSADLYAATAGVQLLFHANPTSVVREVSIAEDLVAATRANDIEHIVYHSVIHPDIVEMFHHQEKGRVEDVFRASGIPSTFLRASHFMQNYLDFWEFIQAGTLPYPTSPNSVMGVVDTADVVEVSTNILTSPHEHAGRTYDLSSHELNRHQMAEAWSEVLGHPVSAVRIPPTAVKNPLDGAGAVATVVARSLVATKLRAPQHLGKALVQSANVRGVKNWPQESKDCYVSMMDYYDKNGLPAGDMTVLPTLLGRPATTYRQFAAREAAHRTHKRR
jgi:uncharacterized protein YbjT (DUF2867 family)